MLVTLDAPYEDTTAAELSLALDTPERAALYTLDLGWLDRLGHPGVRLRLRLLGASHQVVLDRPARDALIETVACLPGLRPELPATLADPVTGYRFTARVRRLNLGEMSACTSALRHDLADDPYALLGIFPGGPDALTAVRVDPRSESAEPAHMPGGLRWRTWHAYPQTGELVETETVVTAV